MYISVNLIKKIYDYLLKIKKAEFVQRNWIFKKMPFYVTKRQKDMENAILKTINCAFKTLIN